LAGASPLQQQHVRFKGSQVGYSLADIEKSSNRNRPINSSNQRAWPAVKGGDQPGAGKRSTDQPASGTGKATPETGTGNTLLKGQHWRLEGSC